MTILDRLIDRTGNWNPQLFRELKQRLTPRNIAVATGLSLSIQGFIWFSFYNQLPVIDNVLKSVSNKYCQVPNNSSSPCLSDATGNILINWQSWYLDIFESSSWILPLGLLIGAVYLLTADLIEEEKRGTLNFIRLSPQSARSIFIGKILGVPILVYLTAALAIPFHTFTGINGGGNISLVLGWYLTIASIWFLFSSISILYVLLGGVQTIAIVVLATFTIGYPLSAVNTYTSASMRADDWLKNAKDMQIWYQLPILSNAIWVYIFCIGICLGLTYWVWKAMERRYLNPTATILSKFQSYQINLCLAIWLVGFVFSSVTKKPEEFAGLILFLSIFHSGLIIFLIPILLPTKQALQDWSHHRATRKQQQVKTESLAQDLITNDKSPTLVSIAINLGMAVVLWVSISLMKTTGEVKLLTVLCSAASLILIYTAISNLAIFLKVRKRNIWTAGIIIAIAFVPMTMASILSINESTKSLAKIIYLFSPAAPFIIMGDPSNTSGVADGASLFPGDTAKSFGVADGTILFAFAAQFILLAFLTLQLQRRLKVVSRSQVRDPISTMPE
jgi:hypothetical protein